MIERVNLFDLPLDIGVTGANVAARIASGGLLMTYLNPLAWKIPQEFPDYAKQLQRFDLIICDGVGIQMAVKHVFGKHTPLISPDHSGIGPDIFFSGAKAAYSLCLVGGRPGVTAAAAEHITREFPGYRDITTFDGYGESLVEARQHILDAAPQMLMVALGMGRQEGYMLDLVAAGWRGVGICVGGVLDRVAQPDRSYPGWSQRINMRFLGRMAREPRRMSKRYFVDYQPFVFRYLKHLLGLR